MKTAVLYLRVSTDEQAFGFSLLDQEKRLTEYCQKLGIEIKATFKDDFTGKTFERPGFKELLKSITKTKVNQVIFTKWSRFSRNTTDSYVMIRRIQQLGTEVQAIDEPVDFSISQNKAMLALYLVMPEIDNDMRADNTIRGIRRANREGRYCNNAPQGYLNARDERDKPILVIDEDKAPLVKEMFELMATGKYGQQQVRKMMWEQGLRYSRVQFGRAIRNPIFIGKLKLGSYKGEPEELISGIHEKIIDETTFYKVQDILSGKKPRKPSRIKDGMPLRGFLYCNLEHKMTGSCSRGHGGIYGYYHCPNTNCERHRADRVNDSYLSFLESIKIEPDTRELILATTEHFLRPDSSKTNSLQQQIKAQEQRIQVLQDKLIDGLITGPDYTEIRSRYESTLFDLKNQLAGIALAESEFSTNFGNSMKLLCNLTDLYQKADTKVKRDIIGSITPGKIYFENGKVRTSEINQAVSLIATIDKGFNQPQILHKVQYEPDVRYSSQNLTGVRTLQTDVKLLSDLFKRVA